VLTSCISVEATAKGLAPHPYVESSNETLPGRAPIETSTYGCGANPAKLLAFEIPVNLDEAQKQIGIHTEYSIMSARSA
jgi:hypothetical protein